MLRRHNPSWSDRWHLWTTRAHRSAFQTGLDSPSIDEHLKAVTFDLSALKPRGITQVPASTLAGRLQAFVMVHSWASETAPTLLFHHDGGEVPASKLLHQIFPRRKSEGLNVLFIEAPFHRKASEFAYATGSLKTYLAMLALPILLTERLLGAQFLKDAPVKAVAGFGQGGFVANWHHVLFDSADIYFPFMAGTAPAEAFLARQVGQGPRNQDPSEILRRLLNFEDRWSTRRHDNVFPVLGSTDLLNPFEAQMRSYGDTPIEVWGVGHKDAAKEADRMREKILRHVYSMRREGGTASLVKRVAQR